MLLAFDLLEPWSCHQIDKIFDDRYSDVFGRTKVNFNMIIFINNINIAIHEKIQNIEDKPISVYALTRYFLLYVVSKIMQNNETSRSIYMKPHFKNNKDQDNFFNVISEIAITIIGDLNYEVKKNPSFDYKSKFKSPKQCEELANDLIASYDKDVMREKAASF